MALQTQRKYQRRSAAEWRALVAQQAVSGLPIGAFCRKVSVSTASFYRWQGLLQKNGDSGMAAAVTAPRRTPDFVDLGALEDLAPSARRDAAASPRVELRLELGGGLVLHLVRG
ncbi:IS66 family insertion sequence element accessory protein TnpA [Acidithiobacillus ferrooxidans]|uniref:IS66 family insertion sequence element accessory protein TnpA n=1 Tax=Acidithiobacillus ferrooxidans TaxID=920 RepID=UPI000A928EC9